MCPHTTAQKLPEEKHKEQTRAAADTEAVDQGVQEAETKEAQTRLERETRRGGGGEEEEEEEEVLFQQYRQRRCQEMKVPFLVFFPLSLPHSARA